MFVSIIVTHDMKENKIGKNNYINKLRTMNKARFAYYFDATSDYKKKF